VDACVELNISRNAWSAYNPVKTTVRFPHLVYIYSSVFVYINYTSNMAACCVNYINDITAPHEYNHSRQSTSRTEPGLSVPPRLVFTCLRPIR